MLFIENRRGGGYATENGRAGDQLSRRKDAKSDLNFSGLGVSVRVGRGCMLS